MCATVLTKQHIIIPSVITRGFISDPAFGWSRSKVSIFIHHIKLFQAAFIDLDVIYILYRAHMLYNETGLKKSIKFYCFASV
jgi:hypothetical protein